MELTKENATNASLLSYVLKSGCKEYPSVSALNRRLQELYGCVMDVFTFKKDCQLVLCLNLQFADMAELMPKAFSVAGNVLLSPKMFLNRFPDGDFSNGVYALSKAIQSLNDNPTQYALFRLFEEMCQDSVNDSVSRSFGLSSDGYLKELSLITPSSLYSFYSSLITSAPVDVYCVSPKSADEVKACFEKIPFFDMARKKFEPVGKLKGINTAGRHVSESKDLNQTILACGYTLGGSDIYAAEVFNELLSGGGNSLLFENVRQREGLCYSVSSKIFPHTGVLAVYAGIDGRNSEKAVSIINECIKKAGSCTEERLTEAVNSLVSKYSLIPDSPQELTGFCFSCRINSISPDIDEYINKIRAVTKADIASVADSVKEQIIYSLN